MSAYLHQDIVFGEKKSRNLGQLANTGRVCVRDHGPQLIQSIIKIMHPSPLTSVNVQSNMLHRERLVIVESIEDVFVNVSKKLALFYSHFYSAWLSFSCS